MLKRLTEQECYDTIKWSVQYLQDYGMHENGLFRESKSQHDIRELKAQLAEGRSRRQLGELDTHVVGGVLVSALKDLPNSLLFEIQENLLEAAELTDGTDECLDRIAAYLSLLPPPKMEVIRMLFPYLHHLAASPSNDANIAHLMIIFAPLFCRPSNTAHMSIRHVDMLRQLRPLLQLTLDNINYIMRHIVTVPSPAPGKDSNSYSRSSKDIDQKKQGKSHYGLQSGSAAGMNLSLNISVGNSPFASPDKKPIQSHNEDINADGVGGGDNSSQMMKLNLVTSMDVDNENFPSSSNGHFNTACSINTHSWGWKLLDSLVCSRVETLIHKSDLVALWNSNMPREQIQTSSGVESKGSRRMDECSSFEESAGLRDGNGGSEMEQDDDQSINQLPLFSTGREWMTDRRSLISECKQLRQQIQQFEEQWISEYKRHPKAHERGHMQSSYARYKEIKKVIRDNAAVSIQKVARGHIARRDSATSGPMEMDQQQQRDYIQQTQYSHLQKRPSSADGYHSSPLVKALAGSGNGDSVSLSTSLPLTRSISDEGQSSNAGASITRRNDGSSLMMETDSKSPGTGHISKKPAHQNAWLSHDSDPSQDKTGQELHMSDSKPSSSSSGYSQYTTDMCTRYQEALESKKSLKKMLKKFDDDFVLKKGRAPKKTDKEVMRPQYQKYHEVRGELEKLKSEIVKVLGYFPKELEDKQPTGTGEETLAVEQSSGGKNVHHVNEASSHARHSHNHQHKNNGDNIPEKRGSNMDEDGDEDDDNISGTSISSSVAHQHNSSHHHDGSKGTSLVNLEALNQEKKSLHSYLKSFEKEFNRANGRHVMHPEDILPVAKEYQRYKDLKKILKDYKAPPASL